jgi:hypothetical protein
MRLTIKPSCNWILQFIVKTFSLIILLNLVVLPILWALKILYIFTLILMYEAAFIFILGVFQILGSCIYREDSIPYRMGFRTGWFDFRKFSKLKSRQRQLYRQEGIIMTTIGLALFLGSLIAHFYVFFYP